MDHWINTPSVGHRRAPLLVGVAALAIALSSALPLTSGGQASASNSLFSTTGQTTSAFAGGFDPTSGLGTDVMVSQAGSASNPQTWLWYDVYQIDNVGNYSELAGGYGLIPSTNLQATGGARPTKVTLNTDTSANPSFTVFAGSGGVLSITWTATGMFWGTSSGSFQDHVGKDIVFQSGGSHYSTAASSQGQVLGYSLPGASGGYSYGELDSSQGMSVCRACSP